jgi:enoyl-[acyl-carrier-protein] reductase (NADH)
VYSLHAEALGLTREHVQDFSANLNPLKRLLTLAEVANVAAFMASDQSSAMTAAVANLSCGLIADEGLSRHNGAGNNALAVKPLRRPTDKTSL